MRALFALLSALLASCAKQPETPRYNVVLLTFDTTRADFIGAYGRKDASTPTLDDLAARGFLFEHARTSNPITQPAHSTILTGVYPLMHGVRDNGLFHLPEELDTLAELLKAAGYRTGAAIGGFPLTRQFGTDQGFDFYDDDLRATRQDHRGRPAPAQHATWYDERPAPHVNDAILGWLREPSEKPFFAWLHYWDPHEPHIAPPPYGQIYAHDPYQGEIAFADNALGTLLTRLDELGELDRTIIVMTSDHGEGRGEHNEATHAFLAYETTLHVPLIMYAPQLEGGRRIGQNVGTVDIVPSVLDLLDIPIPERVQGRSLLPLMAPQATDAMVADQAYYAESMSPRLSHGIGDLRVVYDGPHKLIYGPRTELFNLDSDPAELLDLADDQPDLAGDMKTTLQGLIDWHAGELSADHEFDADTIQRLAGLGYLNMTGGDATVSEELRTDGGAPQDHVGDINKVFALRRLLSSGNHRRAIAMAEDLLTRSPGNPYLQSQLALAHAALGDFAAAVGVVRSADSVSMGNVNAFAQVAESWSRQPGSEADALELLRSLAKDQPTQAVLVRLGQMEIEQNEIEPGLSSLEQAIELDSDAVEPRLLLATRLIELDRASEAQPHVHAVLATHPTSARAHQALSQVHWAAGNREEALNRLQRALLLEPGHCAAHALHAEWLATLGRTEDADRAGQKAPAHCDDNRPLASR